MPGYHVHAFFTAAGFDTGRRVWPAGKMEGTAYAGSMLFMSDPSQRMENYDVYHSFSNVGLGPFSQSYAYLGKVHQLYAVSLVPPPAPRAASMREVPIDARTYGIRALCGWGAAIHEIYAMAGANGGLDLYVHTMGQRPRDIFAHYYLDIAEPTEWWRARDYSFIGLVTVPEWAPVGPRAPL